MGTMGTQQRRPDRGEADALVVGDRFRAEFMDELRRLEFEFALERQGWRDGGADGCDYFEDEMEDGEIGKFSQFMKDWLAAERL